MTGWQAPGDYGALNAMTHSDRYPIPHVLDFHTKLHGKTTFSKIELLRAFHQIPVAKDDVPKTTAFGLFEYPFRNFSLCNAAQTFQRLMDRVMRRHPRCLLLATAACRPSEAGP